MAGVLTPAQFTGVPAAGGTFTGPVTIAGLLTTQAGQSNSGAAITSAQPVTTTGVAAITAAGNISSGIGSLDIASAGQGLQVKEGANAKQGTATLVAGTVTVANTSVTASSRILATGNTAGGTPGGVNVSTRTAGTSFTLTSTNAADTSVVAFQMFEPG